MSVSLFIPATHCIVYDEEGEPVFHNSIRLLTEIRPCYSENMEPIGGFTVEVIYVIDLEDRTLQIYPSHEDNSDPTSRFRGFLFSGFYESAKKIIELLNMPKDSEIY